MIRDEFEKFAAAEFGAINLLRWLSTGKYQVDLYEFAWQGFQAGHAAGLEKGLDMAGNKAVETGWYVAAEEIRAMKKQKK